MNAEQKQRAMQMLRRFSQANPRTLHADNAAVDMATLLQELIDAPQPPKLSDERILELVTGCAPDLIIDPVLFARAIERELLGGEHE